MPRIKKVPMLMASLLVVFSLRTQPQTMPTMPANGGQPPPAITVTLAEALKRAEANSPQLQAALTDLGISREDRVQARAALLPGVSYSNGAIYTQPNGTPEGRFIASNAVREYISQGVAHETISLVSVAEFRRARAAEALATARTEIAKRGLVLTVVQAYYGLVVAQRKTANAQQAADEAQHFLNISRELERGGEVAHADVIKAELQANDRQRDLEEAQLAAEKSRLTLAVLLFPNFMQDFTVVDDLRFAPPLPPFADVQQMAKQNNPALSAAFASLDVANKDVEVARGAHLPSLSFDYIYGIDAPQFASRTGDIRNLGYGVAATLNIPVWSWGATQSKVRQAELRRYQVQVELSAAQRQAIADLQGLFAEAEGARARLDVLRNSAELALESLRLTNLRYQAGEATALEVVDAQNALTQARNAYDDGEARYRVALANLQTLTGRF